MNMFKEHWRRLTEKIDALALRERALIFLMLAVILITPINLFLIDPLRIKQKTLSKQLAERYSQLEGLQVKLQGMAASTQIDPNVELRNKINQLKKKLQESEAPLETVQQALVTPEKKAALLEDLLLQNPRLRLVSLRTMPVSSALDSRSTDSTQKKGGKQESSLVYRHGLELTIEGSYLDLLQYLALLEKLPWRVVWGEADFKVQEYPKVLLKITLYTLSLEKIWMSV